MNYLSLDKFLEHFYTSNHLTFTDFFNTAVVKTSKTQIPLKTYISNKNVTKTDLKLLYDNIKNRNEYLTRFYKVSLFVDPNRFSIYPKKPMKNNHINNNEELVYKNVIRNLYWKDILQKTKYGIENIPTYLDVLEDLYLNNIIDYKIITPSSIYYMKEGKLSSVFSSYYFRSSIMNPYLVYSINHSILKGTKIFTPTLGWTSYLYGFFECPFVIEYVGTDVIPNVCKKTTQFAEHYYPNKLTNIYCEPSENLSLNNAFMQKYKNHFDVVFFSPPYYKLEKYKGGKQSIETYKTYEEWLDKYWEVTIKLCKHVLIKGGKLCYILSNYGSDNTKEKYNLVDDMNKITEKFFIYDSYQPMYNKDVHVTKHKETNEKIFFFHK
jgi:hypothetical protein